MRRGTQFLLLFFLVLQNFFSSAYACGLKDETDKVAVELIKDRKFCKDVSASFPSVLSYPAMGWANPRARLEIIENGETIFEVDLQVEASDQENYSRTHFCLPVKFLPSVNLAISYEGAVNTEKKDNGSTVFSVPLCDHTIVIDNLDELIAKNK